MFDGIFVLYTHFTVTNDLFLKKLHLSYNNFQSQSFCLISLKQMDCFVI